MWELVAQTSCTRTNTCTFSVLWLTVPGYPKHASFSQTMSSFLSRLASSPVWPPLPSSLLSSSTITPHCMKLMLLSNFCLYQLLVDLFVHLARYVMFIVPFLETKCLHSYTFFFTHFTSPSPITPYSLSSSGTTPSPMHTHPHITHLIYAHPVTLHIHISPLHAHTTPCRGKVTMSPSHIPLSTKTTLMTLAPQ